MAILEFYGVQVQYDGRELGIYKPRGNSTAAQMLPEYATCDVFHLEAQAKNVPRDQFVDALRSLREFVSDQASGNVGPVGFLLKPTNFSDRRQALENTRNFVDQVLTALGGK